MLSFIFNRIFRNMVAGEPRYKRIFDPTNPMRNLTVIVCPGPLDAHRLAGAIDVLTGKAHARTYPRKKGDRQMMIVEGQG